MRLMKFAIIGAAVAVGISYILQNKDESNSFIDELSDKAPEWMDKAKDFAAQAIDKFAENVRSVKV